MPPEIFSGPDLTALFAQAQGALGADAFVLSVTRTGSGRDTRYELSACGAGSVGAMRTATRRAAPWPDLAAMAPCRPMGRAGAPGDPVVIALVGPTGAGKTTTIAKLANHPQVFGGWTAGLLSLDTYRVGAIEQSRIYAELSGLPFEVVYEDAEVEGALARLKRREVVLVDTAGRSPRRREDLAAKKSQLARLQPAEVHLVLPAGLQAAHARRLLAEYRPLGVTHLLPTKMDECPDDPTVFELAADHGLPMRWVATGQEVPRDLASACGIGTRARAFAGVS